MTKLFGTITVTLCGVSCLALSGCGNGNTSSQAESTTATTANTSAGATTASATEKLSGTPFTVAYNQWIGFAGIFMAQEQGLFKKAGLDVQFKQFAGPADGTPPLIAGQLDADLTTADTPILLSRESNDNKLHNVMLVDTSHGADGVVAQKGFKTLKDLKGKTIAVTKGQCNELLLLRGLEKSGMTEQDVTITNMDADAGGAAVLAGKVPAAVTWEPWLSKAKANGGSIVFSSAETPNLLLDVLTVSDKTLKEKPADVRAFVAVCLKGNEMAAKDPQAAAKVAQKYLGTTPAEALAMLKKVSIYGVADNARLIGTEATPGVVAKSSADIANFFVKQKVMSEAPAKTNLFTSEYLPKS